MGGVVQGLMFGLFMYPKTTIIAIFGFIGLIGLISMWFEKINEESKEIRERECLERLKTHEARRQRKSIKIFGELMENVPEFKEMIESYKNK
jgi:predicted lipid-binding transport protein (Tim44 family)